jgi:hypothetical protein
MPPTTVSGTWSYEAPAPIDEEAQPAADRRAHKADEAMTTARRSAGGFFNEKRGVKSRSRRARSAAREAGCARDSIL